MVQGKVVEEAVVVDELVGVGGGGGRPQGALDVGLVEVGVVGLEGVQHGQQPVAVGRLGLDEVGGGAEYHREVGAVLVGDGVHGGVQLVGDDGLGGRVHAAAHLHVVRLGDEELAIAELHEELAGDDGFFDLGHEVAVADEGLVQGLLVLDEVECGLFRDHDRCVVVKFKFD